MRLALACAWVLSCGGEDPPPEDPAPDCGGFGCVTAPPPACDGDDLITSQSPGACVADGVCTYPEERSTCEFGCDEGECLDPCSDVVCADPPPDACDVHTRVRHTAEGDCLDGQCTYDAEEIDCTDDGETCVVDDEGVPDCEVPPPACDDEFRNGNETDTDCGGRDCLPCGIGARCSEGDDCTSGVCDNRICAEPTCRDRVHNQDETDVDCGGETCGACDVSDHCLAPEDCLSSVCGDDETCRAPSCTDEVVNADETDLDCGGGCPPCDNDRFCVAHADCASRFCYRGGCSPTNCDDDAANGNETGIDCGGPDCVPCPRGQPCVVATDCEALACDEGMCVAPTCVDGVLNGTETALDCGGGGCPGCEAGNACERVRDCLSGVCSESLCWPATCDDELHNGEETDFDCGGPDCDPCHDDARCAVARDCAEGVCLRGRCATPTCGDAVLNGDETDLDCGGPDCPGCPLDQACALRRDCESDYCSPLGLCRPIPSCDDARRNGDETDIDCGGSTCDPCNVGRSCVAHSDCVTVNCDEEATCGPFALCDDGAWNGTESSTDCGGDTCPPCELGESCFVADDCLSVACVASACVEATCEDGVQNGGEFGIDCGGECPGCPAGTACVRHADCASSVCEERCLTPSCVDFVLNGDETGVDCGGGCGGEPCPTECPDGWVNMNRERVGPEWRYGELVPAFLPEADAPSAFAPVGCADSGYAAVAHRFTAPESGVYGIVVPGRDVGVGGRTVLFTRELACEDGAAEGNCVEAGADWVASMAVELAARELLFVFVQPADAESTGARYALSITNITVSTCTDGFANGVETDIDCGGGECPACPNDSACLVGDDCESNACELGTCTFPTCGDGRHNGEETGVDCGGPDCAACEVDGGCTDHADCLEGLWCIDDACTEPACDDGIHNGEEVTVDCGGGCGGDPCALECEGFSPIELVAFGDGDDRWLFAGDGGGDLLPGPPSLFEPPADCAPTASPAGEVVFRFIAPEAGTYTMRTNMAPSGADTDTVLYVLHAQCRPGVEPVACNDDADVDDLRSSLAVTLEADDLVFIVVDGHGPGDAGRTYALDVERSD